ncbi:acyltransferase family protein [Fibrobacter sp. UWH1]|uniref:acyltransferase family protein n=1 Tax=Fibrobacter sp. UWH1 TaxID=1964354 RepID=UPI000B5205DB|nr:acyltransferase family protein [Fibrobacter sp. UWH1]OWV06477.1 hypothetical protein B7992_14835 [Fibrobacter sp. UWH1]
MRIPYFDFLKGVAIIMVVAIHCMSVAYKNTESVDFLCFFIRNLMNVAVPIFLSVSGFFVAKKSFESASDFIGYLKKQIPRVYFPVLFCSIPFAIAGIVKGRILSTLVMYFTCGYSIYYFIEVIIQCYLEASSTCVEAFRLPC